MHISQLISIKIIRPTIQTLHSDGNFTIHLLDHMFAERSNTSVRTKVCISKILSKKIHTFSYIVLIVLYCIVLCAFILRVFELNVLQQPDYDSHILPFQPLYTYWTTN